MPLLHIADRVLNRPLLITPEKAAVIMSVLAGRIGVDSPGLQPEASRFVGDSTERDQSGRPVGYLPYRRTENGVAILTITGSLVNRGAWIGASSGLTSYEGIKHQLAAIAADPKVQSAILDISSPGGEAIGAFETAEAVRALAKVKRTVAVVNGMAASAAYAIASGATEIVTTETGVAGSIGVVLLHADYSANLATEGIKPTLIFAGAHKVDGNPFEPLSDAVKSDLQAEVNAFYEKFLGTVETGRGARTSRDKARATEARTFIGEAAVAAGLADRVGTFESVLSDLTKAARSSGRTAKLNQGGFSMSGENEDKTISKADHDRAVNAARDEGKTIGASDERNRIAAIMSHGDVKGDAARMSAAMDLATKAPGMSSADVVAFVGANVSQAPAPKADPLANNPANAISPTIPPGAEGKESKHVAKIDTAAIYRQRREQAKRG